MEEETFSQDHVSKHLLQDYLISEVYVAKLGFLRLELVETFRQRWTGETGDDRVVDDYIDELYSALEKSPHVMEITPSRDDLKEAMDAAGLGISVWSFAEAVSLSEFLTLRIVLPKRKREKLALFPWAWNPEEFTVLFDGAVFAAYAPVDSIPVLTDLGQIARDFLADTLGQGRFWRHEDGFGPSPIHPELYFVRASQRSPESSSGVRLPVVKEAEGDLVVVISDDEPLDVITEPLMRDMRFALSDFYSQRVAARSFAEAVDAVGELDTLLNKRVASYFQLSTVRCLLSGESRSIRKLIAEMHAALQCVSSTELLMKRRLDDASRSIQDSTFLKRIYPYLKDHMASDALFDREAELASMNFAAQETSHFGITQATIAAALAGAVVGGILTLVAQYAGS